jgi:hypothetical protein
MLKSRRLLPTPTVEHHHRKHLGCFVLNWMGRTSSRALQWLTRLLLGVYRYWFGLMASAARPIAPASPLQGGFIDDTHRVGASVTTVEDGWEVKGSPSNSALPPMCSPPAMGRIAVDLVGLCVNCFAENHIVARCPTATKCFCCNILAHHCEDCHMLWVCPAAHSGSGAP